MKDPERREFRVTGQYFAHPGSSSFREMLTGGLGAAGATVAPTVASQVYVYDDANGAPAPDWAREMIDDLRTKGIPGLGAALSGQPAAVDGQPVVIDLTAGHLSAAETASLGSSGERATAVLTGISDVAVPQAAPAGPTGSLCDLTLQVRRSDRCAYTASTRLGFRSAGRRSRSSERCSRSASTPATTAGSPSSTPTLRSDPPES